MVCYILVTAKEPHSLTPASIIAPFSHSNTRYSRKLGAILLARDPRSYESPLNSFATSRHTGWKITHSFERSKSGIMALTISSGQPSWSSVCRKLWPRPGVISQSKSIKFVLLNSYCFARGNDLRDMPELKAYA